jgi:radical SAM superfamily enzyme YgiQ (UPF0313 family)
MSVLLLAPPQAHSDVEALAMRAIAQPSLGLGYLAATLEADGIATRIVDLNIEPLEAVPEGTRVIGLTCYTSNLTRMIRTAFDARRLAPAARIVAGGVHATYDAERLLGTGLVDYVVTGEGEVAFAHLCRLLLRREGELDRVPSLVWLCGGRVRRTAPAPPITDLDALPFPVLEPERYPGQPLPLLTSRGCSFACVYCSSSAFWGRRMRYRSIENVRAEIRSRLQRDLSIVDDNLNLDRRRFAGLCDMLEEEGARWSASCSLSRLDEELLARMRRAGCIAMSVGVESGDVEIQRQTGKRIDLEAALRTVGCAAELGIKTVCGFILFHAAETPESLQRTLAYAERLRAAGATTRFTLNTPFLGTAQYECRAELGLTVYEENPDAFDCRSAVIDTPHFKRAELAQWYEQLTRQNIDLAALVQVILERGITGVQDLDAETIQEIIQRAVR